ncbi:metallophosphoesterase family protein [Desulfonauticus submarinus]
MVSKLWIGIGDIHENFEQVFSLPNLRESSGILISGDITNKGNKEKVYNFFQKLKENNSKIFAQIGNMDSFEIEEVLDDLGINTHLRVTELDSGIFLAGVGYSTFTPFNTPSEVSEDAMAKWLKQLKLEAKNKEHLIFMSHTPPLDTKCDIVLGGSHVGSKSVREFIEEVQPDICLTGHIHESKAIDEIGRTLIVNPGPVGDGGYVKIFFRDGRLELELH